MIGIPFENRGRIDLEIITNKWRIEYDTSKIKQWLRGFTRVSQFE